jgi:predicted RNA-binding protein
MVVSSVRTLFNKDVHKWLNWIGGKRNELLYADIKKLHGLVAQQQTNTADVDYLDLKVIENLIERHRAVKDYYSPSVLKTTTQSKGEKMAVSNEQFFELVQSGSLADVQAAIVAGADVNDKNSVGSTPLEYAAFNNPAVIAALVKAGADVNEKNLLHIVALNVIKT